MGGTTIEMCGTVVERYLPDEFRQTMEAPHVCITITTRLVPLAPETTEQAYEFDGLKDRVIGLLLRLYFKNQTRRHVQNFKRLVEA